MIRFLKSLVPLEWKIKAKLFLNRGDNFHCPFCGFRAKEMNFIGKDFPVLKERHVDAAGRRRFGCPKCGSTDRERLVYFFLKDYLEVFNEDSKGMHILHIAPEKNLSKVFRSLPNLEYLCGDLHAEGYSYPDDVMNLDVTNLPFQENRFDLVICNHVLEHVPDDHLAMSELRRVLKKGGKAILLVPISSTMQKTYENWDVNTPEEKEIHFGQRDHVRIYGQDYFQKLEQAGFNVNRKKLFSDYPKNGLNPHEELIIAY